MNEHVSFDTHPATGRNRGNSGNGKRSKAVLTDACGQVQIDVPGDPDGMFEPVIAKKRRRRLSGVVEVVVSLSAKGLPTGGDQRPLRAGL